MQSTMNMRKTVPCLWLMRLQPVAFVAAVLVAVVLLDMESRLTGWWWIWRGRPYADPSCYRASCTAKTSSYLEWRDRLLMLTGRKTTITHTQPYFFPFSFPISEDCLSLMLITGSLAPRIYTRERWIWKWEESEIRISVGERKIWFERRGRTHGNRRYA